MTNIWQLPAQPRGIFSNLFALNLDYIEQEVRSIHLKIIYEFF